MKRTKRCIYCGKLFYEFHYMKNGFCSKCIEGFGGEKYIGIVEAPVKFKTRSMEELVKYDIIDDSMVIFRPHNQFNPLEYTKQCKRSEKRNY